MASFVRALRAALNPPPPAPPPPPSPTFRTPWRKFEWGNTQYDLQYVKDFEPERDDVKQLRVLLYGPVGAGKSSFINAVSTVVQGRMAHTALASAMNYKEASFTTKFNPSSSLSPNDSDYIATPSLDDRVHVLVCVCSGNAAEISDSALQKMREVREAASELGIPQLLIVTKLDEACHETERDLQNIYKSKLVKKKMTQLSSELGIPLNCILPVKNYSQETSQDPDVDALILNALRLILDFGNDFIQKL